MTTHTIITAVGATDPRVAALYDMLPGAWEADTSAYADWGPDRPSVGQCAVTALAVQDRCGGELVRVENAGDSHYFNRLDDGTVIDLTRDQFTTWDPSPEQVRDRDYLESHPATVARYEKLTCRLTALGV